MGPMGHTILPRGEVADAEAAVGVGVNSFERFVERAARLLLPDGDIQIRLRLAIFRKHAGDRGLGSKFDLSRRVGRCGWPVFRLEDQSLVAGSDDEQRTIGLVGRFAEPEIAIVVGHGALDACERMVAIDETVAFGPDEVFAAFFFHDAVEDRYTSQWLTGFGIDELTKERSAGCKRYGRFKLRTPGKCIDPKDPGRVVLAVDVEQIRIIFTQLVAKLEPTVERGERLRLGLIAPHNRELLDRPVGLTVEHSGANDAGAPAAAH